MDIHFQNPATNILKDGIDEKEIEKAIEKSGYPLQTTISNWLRYHCLRDLFSIQEEWSYIDSQTKETRSMDIHALEILHDLFDTKRRPIARPQLDLLIECKQSDTPYVFFISPIERWIPDFPIFAGLVLDSRALVLSDEKGHGANYPIIEALGFKEHPFIKNALAYASTFSKCERVGKGFRLSGSDSYNQIILPLMKAASYFQEIEKPPTTAKYFDCHLIVCIAVVNAPMIGVEVNQESHKSSMTPWVRVIRHENNEDLKLSNLPRWNKITAIDVVHKDYFLTYMKEHLLPFADEFSKVVIENQHLVATGGLLKVSE